jgi:hypothetical protein
MSEISVTVVGSTTINPTVGNGDTVNVTIASTGERGPSGSTGAAGPANTLSIGTVASGSTASATITGTAPTQVLSLVIPAGAKGDTGAAGSVGATGSTGPSGPANSLSIGTVTSGTAAATITGTAPNQTLNLVLQKGDTGAQGPAGPTGPAVNLTDETPQPLGTASAGTALSAARADHVHAVGSITYSSLSGIPSTFAPAAHSHAVSDVTGLQTALDGKQAAGTYATLVGGQVPSSMLPSFVDDVIDVGGTLPATGDVGKIYVVSSGANTNKIYRWSGSTFVEISPSPGSTDSVTEGSVNLYHTNARAAAAAPVQSVNSKTGTVSLTASDVGAAASSHTHSLASLTQSSATTGQVPTWNGTAWAAATPSSGGGSANIVEATTAAGFPAGASNTIYIATDVGRIYRWAGVYVELGPPVGSSGQPLAAPTGFSATAGNAQVLLRWTAPAGIITDYRVESSTDSGSTWTIFSQAITSENIEGAFVVLTGLTNGQTYRFRLAAVNSAGRGEYSAASSAVTPSL